MLGRRSVVLGLGLTLCACGGHTRHDPSDDAPSASGGTPSGGTPSGGAPSAGMPTEAGAPAAGTGVGGATSTLRGCPDASWGACGRALDLTLRFDGPSQDGSGAWAEPLQIPTDLPMTLPPDPGWEPLPPDQWDRAELPEGACVFRIHGVAPDCLGRGTRLQFGACGGIVVTPASYYEQPYCEQGIAPGCPSGEAWRSINSIWYAVPDARVPESTLLVVCAGACGTEMLALQPQLCLHHPPPG